MLGLHPANLAFRFVLEMAALAALGIGAYALSPGILGWVLAVAVPLAAAVVWGRFNVPGDKSRSGEAPVVVAGRTRLLIELAFFAVAALLLSLVSVRAAVILAVAAIAHYALSMDRIRWLLAN